MPPRNDDARLAAFRACCAEEPHRTEVLEWLLAVTLVVVGVHMFVHPSSLLISHMHMLTYSLSPPTISGICIIAGVMRLGLMARRPVTRRTLRLRIVMCFVGGAVWMQFALAFITRFGWQIPPPGFDMIVILQVCGEVWVAMRIRAHKTRLLAKGLIR